MKTIICKTDGAEILVDDEDYPVLSRFPWYRGGKSGHPMTFFYGKNDGSQTVYMHQIIMGGAVNTDHIDRNCLNMQKDNLRPATHQQNGWNKGKPKGGRFGKPASKYKGVSKCVSANGDVYWRVIIKLTKKDEVPARHARLGPFATEIEAAKAYNVEIVKHRGKYAWLNPIEQNDNSLNINDLEYLPTKGRDNN